MTILLSKLRVLPLLAVFVGLFLLLVSRAGFADDDKITLNMRNAEIQSVIQWIAEQTGKQIVVDPRVNGNVNIVSKEPITVKQAYEIFLTTLDVYGYAAVEANGILRIVPSALLQSTPVQLIDRFDNAAQGETFLHIVNVKNVSASELATQLRPMLPKTAFISALASSNSLIIADQADSIQRLVNLVTNLDSKGSLAFDVLPIQHADVKALTDVVSSLFDAKTNGENTLGITHDLRSNSLIVSGPKHLRSQVKALLKKLDQPLDGATTSRVVRLSYLDSAEMLPVLQGMGDNLAQANSEAEASNTDINIEASESANALILTGPAHLLDELESVIAQLDIRRSQVLVEAIIVEVSSGTEQSLGVEWNSNLSRSTNPEAVSRFGQRPVETFTEDTAAELLGLGLTLGFYRNGSLRALINALQNDDKANILSTPSIMTLDNQEAEILVGSSVPFITGQTTGLSSDTENPFTTIERKDIGISLRVTPHINDGERITLDIQQDVEDISQSAVAADLITNKRSISTRVLIKDNAILVLGGLISSEDREIERKVPVLGDIPLVGRLFKSTTHNKVKRNLMVFIHPVIIDDASKADGVTEERYQKLRQLQEQYPKQKLQLDDDVLLDEFTTYKPRPK